MIITRYSSWELSLFSLFLLLEDREIITAMRYNFDIKNSLFDYRNSLPFSYAKYTSQLFTAATAFKRLYTPSDKEKSHLK